MFRQWAQGVVVFYGSRRFAYATDDHNPHAGDAKAAKAGE